MVVAHAVKLSKIFLIVAYGASTDVRIQTVLQGLDIDSEKKDPDDLDFTQVGKAPAGLMARFEPPPEYEENAAPASDADGVYSYASSKDAVAENKTNDNYSTTQLTQ